MPGLHAVAIRELKARLSEYVRRAREGEIVLVTDRGRVVAELRAPISVHGLPEEWSGLRELVERGIVTMGLPTDPKRYAPSPLRSRAGLSAELLDEEREDRR